MKTIIAPTDFTDVSLNAVNYAADMAQDINAELVLIHADGFLAPAFGNFLVPAMVYDEEYCTAQLSNLQEKLTQRTNNNINIRLHQVKGNVLNGIEEICNREHPFLVVMATHSPSIIERWITQSVTLFATSNLHCPVLVVPDKSSYRGIKNVGLACELQHVYEEPVSVLQAFIRTFRASLHLLHIIKPKEDRRFLEMMLTRHRFHEFDPVLHFMESEKIEEELFDFAKQNAFDILIIMHHHYESSEKSIFKDMVLHPKMPVMVLQPVS
ncbi:universal stress protein [Parafilimonas sp.]|uniref:universal stress protein n=1 Tax=Parafilimonas sp. TaxID=1969739 RepID=UPI003F7DCF70